MALKGPDVIARVQPRVLSDYVRQALKERATMFAIMSRPFRASLIACEFTQGYALGYHMLPLQGRRS